WPSSAPSIRKTRRRIGRPTARALLPDRTGGLPAVRLAVKCANDPYALCPAGQRCRCRCGRGRRCPVCGAYALVVPACPERADGNEGFPEARNAEADRLF